MKKVFFAVLVIIAVASLAFGQQQKAYEDMTPEEQTQAAAEQLRRDVDRIYKEEGGKRSKEVIAQERLWRGAVTAHNWQIDAALNAKDYEKALFHISSYEFQKKIAVANKVQTVMEEALTMHFGGDIALAQNKPDEAEKYYKKAVEINPSYETAHFNLGLILSRKGNHIAAADHYKKAAQGGWRLYEETLEKLDQCKKEAARR